MLCVACRALFVVRHVVFLFDADCLYCVVFCMLIVVCCLLFVACSVRLPCCLCACGLLVRVLFACCVLLFVVRRVSLFACCVLLVLLMVSSVLCVVFVRGVSFVVCVA